VADRLDLRAGGLRVLQVGGYRDEEVVLNTEATLLVHKGQETRVLHASEESIAAFDISPEGRIVCVHGQVSKWRASVVCEGSGAKEIGLRGVLAAQWLDRHQLLLKSHQTVGARDILKFSIWQDEAGRRDLFSTDLFLGAGLATNRRGLAFVSGSRYKTDLRGGWVFDPTASPPYESVVDVLPAGNAVFLHDGIVAFGSHVDGEAALVLASPEGVRAFLIDGDPPRQITASPSGDQIAWARPVPDGGVLYVCRL
jgi:hypothetical protein